MNCTCTHLYLRMDHIFDKSILDNFPAGPEKTPKGPSLFPTVFYPAVQLLMLKFIGVQATAERVVVAV